MTIWLKMEYNQGESHQKCRAKEYQTTYQHKVDVNNFIHINNTVLIKDNNYAYTYITKI